jgi:archaeosine-15-forming tRNA-guanine transglycosylase
MERPAGRYSASMNSDGFLAIRSNGACRLGSPHASPEFPVIIKVTD